MFDIFMKIKPWYFYLRTFCENERANTCMKYEPRHKKTGFLHMQKQRRRSGNREADQRLCVGYMDRTVARKPKSKMSSLQPSSVVVQPGLSRTWSETPKTGFLATRLI